MTRTGLIPVGVVFRRLSRLVVLKGEVMPRLGATLYSADGKAVGYVSDIFGKVGGFYVVMRLTGEESKVDIGEKLYLSSGEEGVSTPVYG